MGMAKRYIRFHLQNGTYTGDADGIRYENKQGWFDLNVEGELIFSHRDTVYTRENFTEGLHVHDYYELILYMGGDVEYINENSLMLPAAPAAVWFLPGQMHTARLRAPSRYERYVLYFSEAFFSTGGHCVPILDFMQNGFCASIPESKVGELTRILTRVATLAAEEKPHTALLLRAYLLELFDLLNAPCIQSQAESRFEDTMAEVKRYIDTAYADIPSVACVAERFFYSREHLSRAFRRSFNISVADYLTKRRVAESLKLLPAMRVADAAYAVGFHSQSAYIAAFKRCMGYLPSDHKKRLGVPV